MPGSPLIGQKSFESDLSILDFRILKIIRGDEQMLPSFARLHRGRRRPARGGTGREPDEGEEDRRHRDQGRGQARRPAISRARISASPRCCSRRSASSIGRTLREANFRRHYGLTVLAIYRHGHSLREEVSATSCCASAICSWCKGRKIAIEALRATSGALDARGSRPAALRTRAKGSTPSALFVAAVIAGGFAWMPLSIAFLERRRAHDPARAASASRRRTNSSTGACSSSSAG